MIYLQMNWSAFPDSDVIYMILFAELILINYKNILFSSQYPGDLGKRIQLILCQSELLC